MSAHELTEYQTHRIDWPDPSSSDRQLADLLENTGRRLRIRWLDTGQAEISTYSWIGVVQFDRYRLHIVPKAAGGNLAVLHMLDYSSGIAALRELPTRRDLATGGTHLRDLVCRLLTITSDTILRQGPARDYITREAALPAVRGRLLADRQVLHRFGQLDQLECRYDEYESDTLDNQILAAGLDLAARTATSPRIRAHARRAAADFAAICDPTGLDPRSAAEQLAYTRHNDHYRAAHLWSLLLLHGGAIQDLYQPGYGQARVFLFDMNRLFEDFVTRLTEHAFAGTDTTVHPQARSRSILIDEDAGRPYAAIVPDLLLARGAGVGSWRRVVDVKYKAPLTCPWVGD